MLPLIKLIGQFVSTTSQVLTSLKEPLRQTTIKPFREVDALSVI